MSKIYLLVPLGKLLTRRKEEINIQELDTYTRITIRMNGQGIVIRDCVSGSEIGTKKQFITKAGQLVLSKIDARNGAFGILPNACNNAIITGNFWAFDVNHELLDIRYFDYLTKTHLFIDFCIRASDGTTNRLYLQESKFLSMEIPLPPLEEQRRIVARVEELVGKIEEVRSLRQKALEETKLLLTITLANIFNNEKWEEIPLSKLLRENSLNGLSPRPSETPPGLPILRISAATSRADAIIDETDFKYLEVSEKDILKYRLERDDLLSCRYNGNLHYTGKFAIYKGYLSKHHLYPDKLIRFRVDIDKIIPDFACLVLNSPKSRKVIESFCATTAGNIGLSAGNLKTVKIPVPPLSEQHRIVAYLDELQTKIDTMKQLREEAIKELDALLPALLDKAFKGEL